MKRLNLTEFIDLMKAKYEIGAYYEFSHDSGFKHPEVGTLQQFRVNFFLQAQSKCGNKTEWFDYIRELSAPIGKAEEPKPINLFVNVYSGDKVSITGFASRVKADGYALDHEDERVACIDLSRFREGEGL